MWTPNSSSRDISSHTCSHIFLTHRFHTQVSFLCGGRIMLEWAKLKLKILKQRDGLGMVTTFTFKITHESASLCLMIFSFFMAWLRAVKGRTTAPVLMWVEALDIMLSKLAKDGFPFHKVYAISGSAQQHGSVYWAKGTRNSLLQNLDPSKSLLEQLQNAFATTDSPMWMDSTTSAQCSAIEEALGGAANVTALTGKSISTRYSIWVLFAANPRKSPSTWGTCYRQQRNLSLQWLSHVVGVE